MKLTAFDWTIIALYFVATLAIGLYCARRARGSTSEFFLSGRDAPWWLAGTSMVATTFSADTPLAVTGMVVANGVAGNWLWWNLVMSGMLTVFFYARLWRRAGVMTDVEFAQLRYSGRRVGDWLLARRPESPSGFSAGACFMRPPDAGYALHWTMDAYANDLTGHLLMINSASAESVYSTPVSATRTARLLLQRRPC